MGEEIWPPLRADMVLTKKFIIELDPESDKPYRAKGHGTKSRRNKDYWKDRNIYEQKGIKIVRLNPDDVIRNDIALTIKDIEYKLQHFHIENNKSEEYDSD